MLIYHGDNINTRPSNKYDVYKERNQEDEEKVYHKRWTLIELGLDVSFHNGKSKDYHYVI
jgi:hypothetical protein